MIVMLCRFNIVLVFVPKSQFDPRIFIILN